MTGINETPNSETLVSVDATQPPGETLFLARVQPLLLVLFVGSTVAVLLMWLAWSGRGFAPSIETPHEVSPTTSQTFWLIVASATSLASLFGMISNTALGLRKERREARAEALDRRRQELEIEKLQLELERQKSSLSDAGKRIDSDGSAQDVPARLGSPDVHPPVASSQPLKEPPSPVAGERNRLADKWSELDGRYQQLTRLLGAVDKDLGQTLDSERRLILQEHRAELVSQRDAISTSMIDLERRLAELGSVG